MFKSKFLELAKMLVVGFIGFLFGWAACHFMLIQPRSEGRLSEAEAADILAKKFSENGNIQELRSEILGRSSEYFDGGSFVCRKFSPSFMSLGYTLVACKYEDGSTQAIQF